MGSISSSKFPLTPHHVSAFRYRDLPLYLHTHLDALFQSRDHVPSCVTPLLITTLSGTGISTCCPSPMRLRLGLGPDLPWVDDRCPGTLRLSVERIPTFLFATHTGILASCLSTCPSGQASPTQERSPTHVCLHTCQSFGSVLQPRSSSAPRLSTSELLRTLLMMAASEPTSWLFSKRHLLCHLVRHSGP